MKVVHLCFVTTMLMKSFIIWSPLKKIDEQLHGALFNLTIGLSILSRKPGSICEQGKFSQY
jgi:hypothetical protein